MFDHCSVQSTFTHPRGENEVSGWGGILLAYHSRWRHVYTQIDRLGRACSPLMSWLPPVGTKKCVNNSKPPSQLWLLTDMLDAKKIPWNPHLSYGQWGSRRNGLNISSRKRFLDNKEELLWSFNETQNTWPQFEEVTTFSLKNDFLPHLLFSVAQTFCFLCVSPCVFFVFFFKQFIDHLGDAVW